MNIEKKRLCAEVRSWVTKNTKHVHGLGEDIEKYWLCAKVRSWLTKNTKHVHGLGENIEKICYVLKSENLKKVMKHVAGKRSVDT